MKILKRNQLIILVIALILVTAGYLNYTSTNENTNNVMTSQIVAELGDATLVSSNVVQKNEVIENEIIEKSSNTENNVIENNTIENTTIENTTVENILATVAKNEDTYFTTSKLERESMYSQMLETYQEIYNNNTSTAEQKNTAITEIANINKIKNSIMIAENLIKTKGFEDVVIFVNTNSVSVIVKTQEITQDQIAQVQNIVSRELGVEAEIIHISTK